MCLELDHSNFRNSVKRRLYRHVNGLHATRGVGVGSLVSGSLVTSWIDGKKTTLGKGTGQRPGRQRLRRVGRSFARVHAHRPPFKEEGCRVAKIA